VVGRCCCGGAFAIEAVRQRGPTVNLDVWLGTRGARASDFSFPSQILWPRKSTKATKVGRPAASPRGNRNGARSSGRFSVRMNEGVERFKRGLILSGGREGKPLRWSADLPRLRERTGQFNGRSRGDEALTFPGLGLSLRTASPTKIGGGTVGCGGLAQGSGWLASFAQGLSTLFQGQPAWSQGVPGAVRVIPALSRELPAAPRWLPVLSRSLPEGVTVLSGAFQVPSGPVPVAAAGAPGHSDALPVVAARRAFHSETLRVSATGSCGPGEPG